MFFRISLKNWLNQFQKFYNTFRPMSCFRVRTDLSIDSFRDVSISYFHINSRGSIVIGNSLSDYDRIS